MKKQHFQPEKGSITIHGHKMEWKMARSKNSSIFGIRGSRIFNLELMKDGNLIGVYDRGWDISKGKLYEEDEEAALCISYLVDKFGKDTPRKRKEMGSDV